MTLWASVQHKEWKSVKPNWPHDPSREGVCWLDLCLMPGKVAPPRAGLGEGGPSQGLSREDFLSKGGLQPAFDALPWGSADRGRRHGADGGLPFSVVFLTVSR